jgi:hypothetical protein
MKRVVGNFVVVCFVLSFGALRSAYSQVLVDEASFKLGLLSLIEAGEDNFESIKGEIDVENDGFSAKIQIPGGQRCVVRPTDGGLNTYSCHWLGTYNLSLLKPEVQRLVQLSQRSLPPDWNVSFSEDSSQDYPLKLVRFNREKYGPSVNIVYGSSETAGVITFNIIANAQNVLAKKKAEQDFIMNTPKTTKKSI